MFIKPVTYHHLVYSILVNLFISFICQICFQNMKPDVFAPAPHSRRVSHPVWVVPAGCDCTGLPAHPAPK